MKGNLFSKATFLQWKNWCSLQFVASRLINSAAQWVGDRKVILLTNYPMYLYRYVTHWLTARIHISCDRNLMSSYFGLWICQVQVTYIVICSLASLEMKWLNEVRLWNVGNIPKGSAIHSVKHRKLYSLLETHTNGINFLGLKNGVVLILKNVLLWYFLFAK